MSQSVPLYKTNNGPCPYRKEGVWESLTFQVSYIPSELYEALLNQGFRRSGLSIYHPVCHGCQRCLPIRIDVSAFRPNKGQRRAWRKNQDIRVEHRSVEFTEESFELYQKYQMDWHHETEAPNAWEYYHFLIESPVQTEMIHYYWKETLVAIGWVDLLSSSISSVYFIFNPNYADRRLGVYSILYEIEYCRKLGVPWLYLGFWIEDSEKMQYKAEYRPFEILVENQWQIPIQTKNEVATSKAQCENILQQLKAIL